MAFMAFTGAFSHFMIGGLPDLWILSLCVIFTLLFALVAAKFANKAEPKVLNRVVGAVLVILGMAILLVD